MAAEPARRRLSQWLYRAVAAAFGADHVSLHDGHVSIARYYRVSYDRVLQMSPWITDPANIRAGDEVRMPTPQRPSR